MWTESFFTVYQALDWEFFSDAEGTFSHLNGPVRKKDICRTVEEMSIMRDYAVTWYTKSVYAKDLTDIPEKE